MCAARSRSPRQPPSERFPALVDAATLVFCRNGYERTQMADVARAMGVSTGAVYQYVESKEALFSLAIRANASADRGWLRELKAPVPTPAPGTTLELLRTVLSRPDQWPLLAAALGRKKTRDPRAELEGILREQYRLMREYRYGLVLLTRSALEFPGLAEVFVLGLRQRLLEQLAAYLESRARAGQFHPQADWSASAALLIQSIAWANHQRPFDPGLSHFPEMLMEDTTVSILARGILNPSVP